MTEEHNNIATEQKNQDAGEQRNQFLKIAQEELIPFEETKIKQEPQIDYRSPELIEYFDKKQINKKNYQSMVNNIVKMCQVNFKQQIQAGHASVSPQSKVLQDLKQKKSKKQQQEKDLSKSRSSQLTPAPPEHKQFIERMNKARKVSEQKRKLKQQYEQSRRQAQNKKEQMQRKEKQEKIHLQKEKQIKQKLLQKNKIKQKQKQQRVEALKRYKSVISQKRRHQRMAQNYQQNILQPMMDERSKILQARKNRLKGYSVDQIKSFQIEYNKKQQERAALSRKSKQQWSYTPPPIHPRLYQILQEQKIKERIKMQEKKRALEEKIARQQYYSQYLKDNMNVQLDEKKKQQLEKLNTKKQIKHISKSERWKLGNNYLTELRGKIKSQLKDKKECYSTQQEPSKDLPSEKMKSNTSMGKHQDYDKRINIVHEQRINRLLSSNAIEKNKKISELKLQVSKLNQRAKWKQQVSRLKHEQKDNDGELQVLLSSIKAKIGIMNLYKS